MAEAVVGASRENDAVVVWGVGKEETRLTRIS